MTDRECLCFHLESEHSEKGCHHEIEVPDGTIVTICGCDGFEAVDGKG